MKSSGKPEPGGKVSSYIRKRQSKVSSPRLVSTSFGKETLLSPCCCACRRLAAFTRRVIHLSWRGEGSGGFKVMPLYREKPKFNPDERSFTLGSGIGLVGCARSALNDLRFWESLADAMAKLSAEGCLLGKLSIDEACPLFLFEINNLRCKMTERYHGREI